MQIAPGEILETRNIPAEMFEMRMKPEGCFGNDCYFCDCRL